MNIKRIIEKVVSNVHRTIKNKIYALLLIIIGILSVYIEGDVTFLLFAVSAGLVLFFTKEDIFQR